MRALAAAIVEDGDAALERYWRQRKRPPYAVATTGEVLRWVGGALVRGKLGALGPFFRAGKRQAAIRKELERRRALLARALGSGSISERAAA